MNRHARRWVVAAALVTGVCATAVTASAAPQQSPPRAAAPMQVVAKRGAFSLTGVPAVGVGFIAGGDLYDAGGANKIGQGYSHCGITSVTLTPLSYSAQCTTVFVLPDGQIHMSSLRTYGLNGFNDSKFAITGGTDKYATARGDASATLTDPNAHTYRFDLNLAN